ncbi:MAG: PilZ domain-containing protein [Thiohalomonadaceae bacterium]
MPTQEKRHFQRITMDGQIVLSCADAQWDSQLLDISFKGALLSTPTGWTGEQNHECEMQLILTDGVTINMVGTIVHQTNEALGFRCDHIDLESISHLKRLVKLNLGDEDLLERELAELSRT